MLKSQNHRPLVWWILPCKNIFQRNVLWIEAKRQDKQNIWTEIFMYFIMKKIIKFIPGNYYELWGTSIPVERVCSQLKIFWSTKKSQ